MKRERLFTALLFSTTAAFFWWSATLFLPGLDLSFLPTIPAASVVAAAVVAWLATPRLVEDARRNPGRWRGFFAGVIVTAATYVAGSILIALVNAVPIVIGGGIAELPQAGMGVLFIMAVGIYYSVAFFSPAMIFGGIAGTVLYHLARHDVRPSGTGA